MKRPEPSPSPQTRCCLSFHLFRLHPVNIVSSALGTSLVRARDDVDDGRLPEGKVGIIVEGGLARVLTRGLTGKGQ